MWIGLEGSAEEPKLVVEERADPHYTLIALYIIAIGVSIVAAFAFK